MSDLISRTQAIDVLMEFDKKLRKINWYQYPYTEHECRGVDKAIVKIANLPSAQPEILACKDCKHRGETPIAPGRYWCERHGAFMCYCSDAERRTDQ